MIQIVRTMRTVAILGVAAGAVACASLEAPAVAEFSETVEAKLMAADRAYEAYNLQYGYEAASLKFVDFEQGFMIEAGQGFLKGQAAIMAERQLDEVPSPVHWQPVGAMGAASGDMGITWGSFVVDGKPDTTGNYVTVWRYINGSWKIVTDVAVDDPVMDE